MPIYDYHCKRCGPFDTLRPMAERDMPAVCPVCAQLCARAWVQGPRLRQMAPGCLMAMETNERASHQPTRSADHAPPVSHPSGCPCCSSGRGGATVMAANGAKTFPSKRPWMISH